MFGASSRLDITAVSLKSKLVHPCCHTFGRVQSRREPLLRSILKRRVPCRFHLYTLYCVFFLQHSRFRHVNFLSLVLTSPSELHLTMADVYDLKNAASCFSFEMKKKQLHSLLSRHEVTTAHEFPHRPFNLPTQPPWKISSFLLPRSRCPK